MRDWHEGKKPYISPIPPQILCVPNYTRALRVNCLCTHSCTASSVSYTAQTAQAHNLQKVAGTAFRSVVQFWGLDLSVLW